MPKRRHCLWCAKPPLLRLLFDTTRLVRLAASYIMDVSTGAIVANISGVLGSDQVTFSSCTGWFYAAAFQNALSNGTATPRVAVIASNGTLLQSIVTDSTVAHSIAVDKHTGSLVVPVKAKGILVYQLTARATNGGDASTTSGTSRTPTKTNGTKEIRSNILALIGVGLAWSVLLQE
jgi:hypothetical protein